MCTKIDVLGDLCDVYLGTSKFGTLGKNESKKRKKESLALTVDALLIYQKLRSILYCPFCGAVFRTVLKLCLYFSCIYLVLFVTMFSVETYLYRFIIQNFNSTSNQLLLFWFLFFYPNLILFLVMAVSLLEREKKKEHRSFSQGRISVPPGILL